MQKKVAIIGSGISGLYTAYKLSQNNVVTLYEKENYIGGHTRTIDVIENKRKIPIDTGFIVYNLINYPNFSEMLKELKVKSFKSNMSFAISGIKDEYKLSTLSTVFANKKNIFSFKYYKLLYEIIKFNSEALNMINKNVNTKINLRNYLRKHNLMKIGSSAPDNIMRGIYESAYLSGDVYNNNAEILLHNWNSEENTD